MFDDMDDSFDDLDEEDFLRVALKFDGGAPYREPPVKRRSFELGNCSTKENIHVNISSTSSGTGTRAPDTALRNPKLNPANQTKSSAPKTSSASIDVPVRSCALMQVMKYTEFKQGQPSTASPTLNALPVPNVAKVPIFEMSPDSLDSDLDLSLDGPLVWKPTLPASNVGSCGSGKTPAQPVLPSSATGNKNPGLASLGHPSGSTLRNPASNSPMFGEKNPGTSSNSLRNTSPSRTAAPVTNLLRQQCATPVCSSSTVPQNSNTAPSRVSTVMAQGQSNSSRISPRQNGNTRSNNQRSPDQLGQCGPNRIGPGKTPHPSNSSTSTKIFALDGSKRQQNTNAWNPQGAAATEPEFGFDLGLDFGSDDDLSLADSDLLSCETETPIPKGLPTPKSYPKISPPVSPLVGQQPSTNKQMTSAQPCGASSTTTSRHHDTKRKRKFPGPAGLLPKLRPGMNINEVKLATSPQVAAPTAQPAEPEILSSQTSEDVFTGGPWVVMKQELEPQADVILKAFTISSVIKKASRKHLPCGKVPVICVVLEQLDVQSRDGSAQLRDPTGQMKGTIHRQLLHDHPTELVPGTVMVLRQVGVFSPSCRNHYLNITPSNVVRLYITDPDGTVKTTSLSCFIDSDFKLERIPQSPQLSTSGIRTPGRVSALRPLVPTGGQNMRSSGATSSGIWGSPAGPRGLQPPGPGNVPGRPGCPQGPPRSSNTSSTSHWNNTRTLRPNMPPRTPSVGPGSVPITNSGRFTAGNPRLIPPNAQTPRLNFGSGQNQTVHPNSSHLQQTLGSGNSSANQQATRPFNFKSSSVSGVSGNSAMTRNMATNLHQNETRPELTNPCHQSKPGEPGRLNTQNIAVDDPWDDDQLDQLLTGLDEEMMGEI